MFVTKLVALHPSLREKKTTILTQFQNIHNVEWKRNLQKYFKAEKEIFNKNIVFTEKKNEFQCCLKSSS